ncbi:MAG TPA: GNAT family protein [Gemmatimonadales bacterium]|nr:GNAT family protein [Gemmatimonadales bacterium]
MDVHPKTLEGRHVRLVPLAPEHHQALCQVGLDAGLWEWTTTQVRTPESMRDYIEEALRYQQAGTCLPFTVIHRADQRVIGSTRYGNIDRANRRLEIGWTWYGRPWQRTAVNTECKYLLLRHAFESLGAIRVELKTDSLNQRSRAAILRIGAREEGTLRNHMITWSGRLRHTVYYSVIETEWPDVKRRLEEMLSR